jgi:hypothetical protein
VRCIENQKNKSIDLYKPHIHTIQRTLRTVVPILYLGVGSSIGDGNTTDDGGGGSGFWLQPLEGKLGGGGAVNVDIMAGVVVTKWLGSKEHVCSLTTIPSFLECVIRFGSFPFVVEVTAAVGVAAAAAVILFSSFIIIIGSAAVAAGSGETSYKIAPFVRLLVLRLSSIRIRVVAVVLSISG